MGFWGWVVLCTAVAWGAGATPCMRQLGSQQMLDCAADPCSDECACGNVFPDAPCPSPAWARTLELAIVRTRQGCAGKTYLWDDAPDACRQTLVTSQCVAQLKVLCAGSGGTRCERQRAHLDACAPIGKSWDEFLDCISRMGGPLGGPGLDLAQLVHAHVAGQPTKHSSEWVGVYGCSALPNRTPPFPCPASSARRVLSAQPVPADDGFRISAIVVLAAELVRVYVVDRLFAT